MDAMTTGAYGCMCLLCLLIQPLLSTAETRDSPPLHGGQGVSDADVRKAVERSLPNMRNVASIESGLGNKKNVFSIPWSVKYQHDAAKRHVSQGSSQNTQSANSHHDAAKRPVSGRPSQTSPSQPLSADTSAHYPAVYTRPSQNTLPAVYWISPDSDEPLTGLEPGSVGSETRSGERSVGSETRSVGSEKRSARSGERSVGSETRSVGSEKSSVESEVRSSWSGERSVESGIQSAESGMADVSYVDSDVLATGPGTAQSSDPGASRDANLSPSQVLKMLLSTTASVTRPEDIETTAFGELSDDYPEPLPLYSTPTERANDLQPLPRASVESFLDVIFGRGSLYPIPETTPQPPRRMKSEFRNPTILGSTPDSVRVDSFLDKLLGRGSLYPSLETPALPAYPEMLDRVILKTIASIAGPDTKRVDHRSAPLSPNPSRNGVTKSMIQHQTPNFADDIVRRGAGRSMFLVHSDDVTPPRSSTATTPRLLSPPPPLADDPPAPPTVPATTPLSPGAAYTGTPTAAPHMKPPHPTAAPLRHPLPHATSTPDPHRQGNTTSYPTPSLGTSTHVHSTSQAISVPKRTTADARDVPGGMNLGLNVPGHGLGLGLGGTAGAGAGGSGSGSGSGPPETVCLQYVSVMHDISCSDRSRRSAAAAAYEPQSQQSRQPSTRETPQPTSRQTSRQAVGQHPSKQPSRRHLELLLQHHGGSASSPFTAPTWRHAHTHFKNLIPLDTPDVAHFQLTAQEIQTLLEEYYTPRTMSPHARTTTGSSANMAAHLVRQIVPSSHVTFNDTTRRMRRSFDASATMSYVCPYSVECRDFDSSSCQDGESEMALDDNGCDTCMCTADVPSIGYCLRAGQDATGSGGRSGLCGACQQTRHLGADVFPSFVQEVTCQPDSAPCLNIGGHGPQGVCQETYIPVSVLHRNPGRCMRINLTSGQALVYDDWHLAQLMVRAGCQCMLDKRSPVLANLNLVG